MKLRAPALALAFVAPTLLGALRVPEEATPKPEAPEAHHLEATPEEPSPVEATPGEAAPQVPLAECPHAQRSKIHGIWEAAPAKETGDLVRFYYFHPGDIGLVRFGRLGLTYTKRFHYQLEGDALTLVFDATNRHETTKLKWEKGALVMEKDPTFEGTRRYEKARHQASVAPLKRDHPLARLWMDVQGGPDGGKVFHMYQLQAPTIDGRGVGWYHEGNMAEWSTETLSYRARGGQLELTFPVRHTRESTPMEMKPGKGKTPGAMVLAEDPRNFWHARTYLDAGPGFTAQLEGGDLPFAIFAN